MIMYILHKCVVFFNKFIIFYVAMLAIINLIKMTVSILYSLTYIKKARFSDMNLYKKSYNMIPISILVPAYNEEKVIVQNIKSLLSLEYLNYEIIIVNDGSKDETLEEIIKEFKLRQITFPFKPKIGTKPIKGIYSNPDYHNLLLVDKENGGKADALNAGINISHYPYFVSLDADSLLDSDALVRIASAFMEYKYTVAVGGIIRVLNGSTVANGKVEKLALPKSKLAMFQVMEYLRAFLAGRTVWSILNTVLIISGAFGAFQKQAVLEVGGYTTDTVGEDMDIVVKLHRYMREKKYKYKITFLPDPICWTQVPERLKDLFSQRRRWQVGLMDTMKRNSKMMLNPKYSSTGMIAMPYFFLFEQVAPVVEVLGYIFIPLSYFFGILSIEFFIIYLLAAVVFGVILSIGSLIIEEFSFNKYIRFRDFFKLCLFAILENFSYRQMTLVFRLIAILNFRKYRYSWGKIQRKNFKDIENKRD